MGLDIASIKFIAAAKSSGVDFSNMVMLGRQSIFAEEDELEKVLSTCGIKVDVEAFLKENKYGEELFSLFGAEKIQSLDYSSYEGATIIHDMNVAVPESFHQRYSLVYDGGTLEHVFNVPQALKNCMEMIQVGGHFLQVTGANNFMGHGFWQFSPELIFRVFSEQNGFKTKIVLLHEIEAEGKWYIVSDPDSAKQRVELCNRTPTYILTIAQRTRVTGIFSEPPLQSDYSEVWKRDSNGNLKTETPKEKPRASRVSPRRTFPAVAKQLLPDSIIAAMRPFYRDLQRARSPKPFERSFYRELSESELIHGAFNRNSEHQTERGG